MTKHELACHKDDKLVGTHFDLANWAVASQLVAGVRLKTRFNHV